MGKHKFFICPIEEIDTPLTDNCLSSDMTDRITNAGANIYMA